MSGFSFNIEDKSKGVPNFTTKNQERLNVIEMRIRGIKSAGKHGADLTEDDVLNGEREITRLEAAHQDVKKQMSKEERAEYKAVMLARQPKALTREQQAAITKQMESNKDRPSH